VKVLVTGGTGAVGILITRRSAAEGHEVLCASRGAAGADPARDRFLAPVRDRVRFVAADVADPESLARLWRDHAPTAVVHAAAITPTRQMETEDPAKILNANLMGTLHLLDQAQRGGARRFVFISSAAVYGETDEATPIREDEPLKISGLYSIAKQASEHLCAHAADLHGLDAVACRVGWVYGPMERVMAGSRQSMSLVHEFTRLALAGEEIRVAHLDHVRDWIHGDDLARALLALFATERLPHRVYNLCGDRGYTIRELLDTLNRVVPLHYRQVSAEESNVPPLQTRKRRGPMSLERLMADTGYRQTFSLEAGLRDYVAWVRSGLEAG